MHDPLSKPAENANGPKPRFDNFAFLMNVSKLVGAESFLLAPGHELRRATPEETTIIKRLLLHHGGGMLGGFSYPFEYEIGPNWQMTPLAEEEWRYFVIGFRGSPTTAMQLENAFCLADMEFRIPFTVLRERASELTEITEWMHNGRLPQMLEEASVLSLKSVYKIERQNRGFGQRFCAIRKASDFCCGVEYSF